MIIPRTWVVCDILDKMNQDYNKSYYEKYSRAKCFLDHLSHSVGTTISNNHPISLVSLLPVQVQQADSFKFRVCLSTEHFPKIFGANGAS